MRKPDRNPLHSAFPLQFQKYDPLSEQGIGLRRADAWQRLKEMNEVEAVVRQREAENDAITGELGRIMAAHQLDMQYLMLFGVFASQRETFRQILEEVTKHGGLSLRQAADLAHAKSLATTEQPLPG
ncbi:MAG: hypothetical protein IT428_09750 [Planctomycetaceae bacterium]|nr:hypothetical protein [Planctomycetaceae bacterium]